MQGQLLLTIRREVATKKEVEISSEFRWIASNGWRRLNIRIEFEWKAFDILENW